jgi:adenylate kinase
MLRAAVKAGTPLGREAKAYMDRGALVPDGVIIGLVRERLQSADCIRGYILDGFPRTLDQAKALDQLLKDLGTKLDHVVVIEVPDDYLVERLTGRRTCKGCNYMHHIKFDPPKKEGVCDKCGAELYQRDDDKEETIRQRLTNYHNQTSPLIEYYGKQNVVRMIKGTGSMEQVQDAVKAAIGA